MNRRKLIFTAIIAGLLSPAGLSMGAAQQPTGAPAAPSFRASVDLVRISAIVRDRKGRFVKDLSARDFEVVDGGQVQRITDFQHDKPGVTVALLIDVSGSMEARLDSARDAATNLLAGLDTVRDEAAVFTFDTELKEVEPFAPGLQALPSKMAAVRPFGATSLHDAIAGTAERLVSREGMRRAVVVFTDGSDTWSRMTPPQVAQIASAIDVPVYIVGIVPLIDNPSSDLSALTDQKTAVASGLANLSMWTGGRAFNASTAMDRAVAARQILEELRHQYLIAFPASTKAGWHQLVVRTRDKDHIVRARSGYNAGQSRPVS